MLLTATNLQYLVKGKYFHPRVCLGIEDFPADELKKVKTKEPLSGLELLKQVWRQGLRMILHAERQRNFQN